MSRLRVQEDKEYARDSNTGALINESKSSYEKFCQEQRRKNQSKKRILDLENDVSELKELVKALLDKDKV